MYDQISPHCKPSLQAGAQPTRAVIPTTPPTVIPTGGEPPPPTVIPTAAKRSGGTPAFRLCSCCCLFSCVSTHPLRHPDRSEAEWRDPRIFFPQKPQQIRMSSPSTPKNPHNYRLINHIPKKNSWHSSYAPLDTINIWIKSIEGQLIPRGNKLPPPTCTVLSQPNKPHRINLLPATTTRDVILAQPQESSFWRSPWSRHSGEVPRVVILAKPESPYWLLLCRCTSGGQNKPHRINILPANRSESIFCRLHPFQSLFFAHNPYSLSVLSATSTQ